MAEPREDSHYSAATPNQWEFEKAKMYLDAGWVGKFFGSGANCQNNIAAVTILIALVSSLFITGIAVTKDGGMVYEIWKYTSPVIMGALGYIFGHGTASRTESRRS